MLMRSETFIFSTLTLCFLLGSSGCASLPSPESMKHVISGVASNPNVGKLAIVDDRGKVRVQDRKNQIDELSGSLVPESAFAQGSFQFLTNELCNAYCDYFIGKQIRLLRFDIAISTGRNFGDPGPGPAYIPPGTPPGAAALGILIGGGLVSLAKSNAMIGTDTRVELEIDGLLKKASYKFEVSNKKFDVNIINQSVIGALRDFEREATRKEREEFAEKIRQLKIKED
jgi:hypothetical protein